MWCSEPFLDYLKPLGYCVVRLPKADARPLQVLTREGRDLNRLGELATVMEPGGQIPLPSISTDTPAANISGQRTSNLSLGIGLSILRNVIGAMGGSNLGLEGKYREAKTVTFELSDVLEDRVEIAKLDQFLADADLNPFSRHAAALLEADDLYVTTATLKSRTLTVEAVRPNGAALDLSVPEVQALVGGNVQVSVQDETRSKLQFQGSVPLVFGFQAVRLFYERGRYSAFEPLPLGTSMRGSGRGSRGSPSLLTSESPLVRLDG